MGISNDEYIEVVTPQDQWVPGGGRTRKVRWGEALESLGSVNKILAAESAQRSVYGANSTSSEQVVTSVFIPAGSIKPNSLLELTMMWDFTTGTSAGRGVIARIGSTIIGQVFPTTAVKSGIFRIVGFVTSDAQKIIILSQSANNILAPVAAQGLPFGTSASAVSEQTIDFTTDKTFTISAQPKNGDIYTFGGFSLENRNIGGANGTDYSSPNAVACWGDSLTSGPSSQVIRATADMTTGSTTYSNLSTTSGVGLGWILVGDGVPEGTVITGYNSTTLTTAGAATATKTGGEVFMIKGGYPSQMLYDGVRQVANLGVGGETSLQIRDRLLRDVVRGKRWTCVLDMGRNDFWVNDVVSVLRQCVANLAPGVKYLVNTVTPMVSEGPGTGNWATLQNLANSIKTAFPSNYCDIAAGMTNNWTQNIPLKYRNAIYTNGTITSGTNSLTVSSATGITVGMYVLSVSATAISNGDSDTAPTVTNVDGTTITISDNATGSLSGSCVAFVSPTETHLNNNGYQKKKILIENALAAMGA